MRHLLLFLGLLLTGAVIVQVSGTVLQVEGFHDDFSSDPVASGNWLDMSSNGIYLYSTLGGEDVVTDDDTMGFPAYQERVIVAYDETDGSMGQDGNALLLMEGSVNGTADFHGVEFRRNCSDFSNSEGVSVYVRGDGLVYAREYDGYTATNTPCNGCGDVGDISDGDYIGFQWRYPLGSLQARVWDFDGTPPTDKIDWETWGTCDVGLYDAPAGPPGCTNDYNIEWAGYGDGDCFAFFHQDTSGLTTAGIAEVWIHAAP
jgi:hypothetical protein